MRSRGGRVRRAGQSRAQKRTPRRRRAGLDRRCQHRPRDRSDRGAGALGAWSNAEYRIRRNGGSGVPANVIIGEAERDSTIFYQYAVAAVYLAIGLFVYFRRGNAPRALHFFLLCLASFILFTFHYSGQAEQFRQGHLSTATWWRDSWRRRCSCISASCFPEPQKWIRRRGAALLVYLPGLALLAIQIWASPSGWLRYGRAAARSALAAGSRLAGVPVRDVSGGRRGAGVAAAPRRRSDRAPPVDLAAQRRAARDSAVRADLRGAVPDGRAFRITR